ncbi:MAG: glycoside hydrolase family 16 protein [Gemmatimonadaceae bacterium]|nr:glycoside hydrolase family 16 protein [Gemmatimonadaceae bacterium]
MTGTRRGALRARARTLVALSATVSLVVSASGHAQVRRPPSGQWRLAWRDEFTGPAIDTTRWGFDLGNGFYADSGRTFVSGWGNNELQCYTRSSENAYVRDGALHVRALQTPGGACAYSSARLKSRRADGTPLFAQRYGRFEFRAKLPVGRGLWPALWMLPQDTTYGTWAANGEIDVMEARGQTPSTVLGTLHYGGRFPANTHTTVDYILPRGGSIADFHVYAVEWEPGRLRFLVDDVAYQTQRFWWSSGRRDSNGGVPPTNEAEVHAWPAPFDRAFYLVMNLAVGGDFPGNPDTTTVFPAELVVDFVRVYTRRRGVGALAPRGPGRLPLVTPR